MDTQLVDTPWGALEAFSRDLITEQMVRFGTHQRSDLAFLLSLLRPGDLVIDVGAHIGTYAVPIARVVGASGRVVAIEPMREHFAVLNRNLERNGLMETVKTVNALVSDLDRDGTMTTVPGNTGSAHFIPSEGTTMPSIRLDEVAPENTSLVKIDVEGMELEVLQSGLEMIKRDRPILIFEVGLGDTTSELDRFCRSLGYQMFVNLQDRNGPDDSFRAGRIRNLSRLFVGPPLPLFDIVAMCPLSDRVPSALVPSLWTHSTLFARRTRTIIGRSLGRTGDHRTGPTPSA